MAVTKIEPFMVEQVGTPAYQRLDNISSYSYNYDVLPMWLTSCIVDGCL